MFDIQRFIKDFNISFKDSGKNCAPGWININCPKCNDSSFHLGFDISTGYNNCWKCGPLNTIELISLLLSTSKDRAQEIFKHYYTNNGHTYYNKTYSTIPIKMSLPSYAKPLTINHKKYLSSRNFDPDYLEKKYDLLGTTHLGDYKWRIIIPIYFNGRLVSFQSRDITGKSQLRYKAANKNNEIIHHKDILYGADTAIKNSAIIVEGVFDKWRIGDDSVCTFGVSFTQKQILLISKKWSRVFILYDNDIAGITKAEKLANQLAGLSIEVEIITLSEGDPGSMSDKDAKLLVRELIK